MANKLPQGWVECKLGDVLYLQNGYAFNSKDYSDEGVNIIRISDIQNNNVSTEKSVKYNKGLVDECFQVKKGDFLIAMSGATTGKTGTYTEDEIAYLNQRVGNLKIRYKELLLERYRDYFIANKRREIEKKAYGGAQPNISKQMIEDLELLLPPLNEQKRIVEKIEEEFEKIDEGIEKLKLAQEQIKQYRQSVLKSAFEGKLYKTTEWKHDTLGKMFNTASGGTPKRSNSAYYGGTIPWLKSGELNNGIITEAEEYITEEGLKNSSAKIFPRGSLLIALYGATVGKLGILDFDSTTNQAICCVYQNKNYNRNFLFYYLLFKKDYLVNQGKGGAQPNISQEIIKALVIPIPTLAEQKQIVEEIEERFEVADEAEGIINDNLANAEQLKQTILKKAFEGRLVPQDPTDEPASVLLEKIKSERNKK